MAGLDADELALLLPSFIRLYRDFGVNWDLAYHIIRPQLHRSIYVSRDWGSVRRKRLYCGLIADMDV